MGYHNIMICYNITIISDASSRDTEKNLTNRSAHSYLQQNFYKALGTLHYSTRLFTLPNQETRLERTLGGLEEIF